MYYLLEVKCDVIPAENKSRKLRCWFLSVVTRSCICDSYIFSVSDATQESLTPGEEHRGRALLLAHIYHQIIPRSEMQGQSKQKCQVWAETGSGTQVCRPKARLPNRMTLLPVGPKYPMSHHVTLSCKTLPSSAFGPG